LEILHADEHLGGLDTDQCSLRRRDVKDTSSGSLLF
jgi:hypothetical protein